jgi:hypothetical protein
LLCLRQLQYHALSTKIISTGPVPGQSITAHKKDGHLYGIPSKTALHARIFYQVMGK